MIDNMHSWEEYILTRVNPNDVHEFYDMMNKIYVACRSLGVTDWDLEYCEDIIGLLQAGGF